MRNVSNTACRLTGGGWEKKRETTNEKNVKQEKRDISSLTEE